MGRLLLALFLIKHIIFCIFPSGSCLWAFLRWQIPENLPFLYWKLWRDRVSSFFSSQDLFSFWFRSVNSIMLALMHGNAHILRTIVHSLLVVKVLSTFTLFQETWGRESLDRAMPSYLHAFAVGSVMVTIIFKTGAFLALWIHHSDPEAPQEPSSEGSGQQITPAIFLWCIFSSHCIWWDWYLNKGCGHPHSVIKTDG